MQSGPMDPVVSWHSAYNMAGTFSICAVLYTVTGKGRRVARGVYGTLLSIDTSIHKEVPDTYSRVVGMYR